MRRRGRRVIGRDAGRCSIFSRSYYLGQRRWARRKKYLRHTPRSRYAYDFGAAAFFRRLRAGSARAGAYASDDAAQEGKELDGCRLSL